MTVKTQVSYCCFADILFDFNFVLICLILKARTLPATYVNSKILIKNELHLFFHTNWLFSSDMGKNVKHKLIHQKLRDIAFGLN